MDIYMDYWWPLEPPPYHHPGKPPNLSELQEVQALQDNYTAYWRSLPKYTEVSGLVERVQHAPYFKVPWQRTVARTRPGRGQGQLYFVCHHKTGVDVHDNMIKVLAGSFHTHSVYEPDASAWPVDKKAKVLHLVRDPVDTILSGYRYHEFHWGAETWSWGHGRTDQDPACFMCDDEDHRVIFDTCKFNCTYFELLNRVDETTGIVLEAVSARKTITSMAKGLAAWAGKDNVLQISLDLLSANPTQTTACIFKFLGLANQTLAERFEEQTLRIVDPDHITSGVYNNTFLKEFLETHLWSKEFQELREVIANVYKRQAALYGCPASP